MDRKRGRESAEELWLEEAVDEVLAAIAAVTRNDAPPTGEERDTIRQIFRRRLEGRAIDPTWEEMRSYVDQTRTLDPQEEQGEA